MPTNNSRSISAVARLFRAIPAETLKATIDDIEDQHSEGGESAITRQEALTGPAEAMHGGNAAAMVRRHSDLDAQRGRQAEYDAFSGILSDIAKAMKAQTDAITAIVAPKVAVKAVETDTSYLAVVEKSLKIVARELFKAETDEDDDEDKDSKKDSVEKAERHLAKAAKLLAKAEDDDKDEDEEKIEKARADIRKLTKALKPFREAIKAETAAKEAADAVTKAATEAAAAAAMVAAKADEKKEETDEKKEETAKSALETSVAALHDQFGMVTKSVTEVMDMVSGLSRGAKQPNFVAKAAEVNTTAEPVDFTARAEEAADNGRLSTSELIKCNNIISRLTIAKSGSGGVMNDVAAVKADVASASSGVREVFASLLTA